MFCTSSEAAEFAGLGGMRTEQAFIYFLLHCMHLIPVATSSPLILLGFHTEEVVCKPPTHGVIFPNPHAISRYCTEHSAMLQGGDIYGPYISSCRATCVIFPAAQF